MRGMFALAVLALLASTAGCLREYEDPHHLRVVNIDLAPARVLARELTLGVNVTLDNRGGGATGNVELIAKAYSESTGFLLAEDRNAVGTIPGDTTREIPMRVQVPREGSVRVDVSVLEDGQGQQSASVHARNLGVLEPEVVDTGVRVSGIDFVVTSIDGEGTGRNDTDSARVRVQSDLYLTNEGNAPSEALRVQVKAREVTTQLVADVAWLDAAGIVPGSTSIRSVNLTVPDGYNYVFEILTWRGDVIVARNEGTVQLAPTFQKPADQDVVTTNPDVRDFLSPTRPTTGAAGDGYGQGNSLGGSGPGMPEPEVPGVAAPLVALVAGLAAIFWRRRSR